MRPFCAQAEKDFWPVSQVRQAPSDLDTLAQSVLMVEVPTGEEIEIDTEQSCEVPRS